MQEKLTKVRVRAQILLNIEFGEEQELQGEILGNCSTIFALQANQGR